jgi:hypothetical protein
MNEVREKLLKSIDITNTGSDLSNLNWQYICEYCVLSEEFIREFKEEVLWDDISENQVLSEDFIREFQHKVYWPHISHCQKFSDEFLLEFSNKINWFWYLNSKEASFPILMKFIPEWNKMLIEMIKTYHLTDLQREKIKKIINLKYLFND